MRNETEAGEIVREYIAMNCDDGNLHQRDENEEQLVDRLSGELEIKSSANVAGTTEVKRWSYRNELGQEVIGVVRAWTLDGLNSATQVKDQENDLSVALKPGSKMYDTKSTVGEELSNPEEDF